MKVLLNALVDGQEAAAVTLDMNGMGDNTQDALLIAMMAHLRHRLVDYIARSQSSDDDGTYNDEVRRKRRTARRFHAHAHERVATPQAASCCARCGLARESAIHHDIAIDREAGHPFEAEAPIALAIR